LANYQEIIRMPAEMLGLQMDFHHGAVEQDRRDALYKELGEPVGSNVLLEERTCFPSGGGT
jgi:hypothetical protein